MNYSVVNEIYKNFEKFPNRIAFHIGGENFSYSDLKVEVYKISKLILNSTSLSEKHIAIFSYDSIRTYSSILACWMTGKAYVPLNPAHPVSRNLNILKQMGIKTIISSEELIRVNSDFSDYNLLSTNNMDSDGIMFIPLIPDSLTIAYILFTSGSTGKPKGVTISHENLSSFVYHFIHSGYSLSEEDRFLQIYDLSFDASVHCFTVPLSLGASVYTVPPDEIKYLYAYKLMSEHKLSFVKMPPSTLAYLKPFFDKIRLNSIRYCLLGGEAFSSQLAFEWADCVPNAQIQNVYGPTELTINCLIYNWNKSAKDYRGVVSIGRTFGENEAIVIDSKNTIIEDDTQGELCLSGSQVSPGYWNDEQKNRDAFITLEIKAVKKRYYKTGDLVLRDKDGDFMFCGRIDSQVQIQGYRVELGEIEEHSRFFLKLNNLAAIAVENDRGTTEIYLFTEGAKGKEEDLQQYLLQCLPKYMLPTEIIDLDVLPKSAGGKIDRSKLKKIAIK